MQTFVQLVRPLLFLIGDTWDDTQQGGWGTGDWGDLRQINYFLDNLPNAKGKVTDATYLHNEGVGRFWRAYFYYGMVRTFGDVPWYETTLEWIIEMNYTNHVISVRLLWIRFLKISILPVPIVPRIRPLTESST